MAESPTKESVRKYIIATCTDNDMFAAARKRVEEFRRDLGIKSDKK